MVPLRGIEPHAVHPTLTEKLRRLLSGNRGIVTEILLNHLLSIIDDLILFVKRNLLGDYYKLTATILYTINIHNTTPVKFKKIVVSLDGLYPL